MVGSEGQTTLWSPEEELSYFSKCSQSTGGCDIWVLDRQTGEEHNLSNTPDRDEMLIGLCPARPDVLIFYSTPKDTDAGAGWLGYLTSMHIDGTHYSVLVDSPMLSKPALSSDGQTIAYVSFTYDLLLYEWGFGSRMVDWQEYGLAGWEIHIYSVSWSPDGNKIACWAWGRSAEDEFNGIVVLDLEAEAIQILQPLRHPVYFDGYPPPPEWSPDGRWLSFFGVGESEYGIWVVSVEGIETHVLAEFTSAEAVWDQGARAWSPDGRWLALTRHPEDPKAGVWLAEVGQWEPFQIDLPARAEVADWVDIGP
jgi:Tol biopolymer transport system component